MSVTRVTSVVIPAAGLGSRLLTATKEQPKEMLPIFARGGGESLCLKPMLQQIFEQLFDLNIRRFYFIVGREKRAIEDHFTPDTNRIRQLKAARNGRVQAKLLEGFYTRIERSTIVWVNQPMPKGFGEAVLRAEGLVDEDSFMVHAGDSCVISSGQQPFYKRLIQTHAHDESDATLSIHEVSDPRHYGVVEISGYGEGPLQVKGVTEKPARPRSKLAILPMYVFRKSIFDMLRITQPDKAGEIQLTDGIQKLIQTGRRVQALKLGRSDVRLDIGRPETYWEALQFTYMASRKA
jgi:UTP--glucose-1-phosphate uridylyltransferase